MTPDPAIATAADYADAMITARRAKNTLILLLLLMLLAQLAFFFVVRFTDLVPLQASASSTQPAGDMPQKVHYFASGCMFLGVVMSIALSFVLLLIVNIMLVGRLIGVGRVTSGYIWSLILMLLLFPWQAFLNNVNLTPEQATFKIPGVLYTWSELTLAKFQGDAVSMETVMHWARFVGFPLLAVVVLLAIQIKSNRGIRQALGEDEITHPELNP